jgi:phenylacetate-CoA ligase
MKSILESLYLHCPIFLQNILASLKGFSIEKIRHGGDYGKFIDTVLMRNRWSLDEFSSFQDSQLIRLIKHAYEYVPYYRELYNRVGITPEDINSVADIVKLPIITKEEVRANTHRFIDERFKTTDLLKIHTTGTTGTPLVIFCDKTERQWNYAFYDAYLRSVGVNVSGRRATLGGRIIVSPKQKKPPFWRYSYFQKNLLFSSYHLNEDNLPTYIDRLRRFQPEVIDAYPSSIYIIANYMIDRGIGGIRPSAVITSAETLFDEQREAIEKAFQCNVYDQYGAAEMCVFVAQCKKGYYHIRPDYAIVEFLEDERLSGADRMAEVVCTSLINRKMPLIRYRIGDLGIASNAACGCGLHTPIMKSLQGRIDDTILTKSGVPIGRLSPVLKGFPIREALYVQEKIGELIVQVVKADNYSSEDSKAILTELRKRVGDDMDLRLEFTERIEREAGQKNKAVISKLEDKASLKILSASEDSDKPKAILHSKG